MDKSHDSDTGKPMDKRKAHAISAEIVIEGMCGLVLRTSKNFDVTIFVWDPNPPPAWEPLGMFEDIIEENDLVPWQIKDGCAELYLLLSDFVIGEMEPIPYSAAALAGRAVSYGSGTHSYGSRSAASGTPIEEDAETPVGQALKMQILQSRDMRTDYARLLADAKSSNVHIGVQRYDAIQSAIQVWKKKQGDGSWPSNLVIKADNIRSVWWGKSAFHEWQACVNDLEKLSSTIQVCADMLDWLRELEGCKSERMVWGDRYKSNGQYSLVELKNWISDVEQQQALVEYAATKASKGSTKSHKKRK
ncbi:hypothetical protein H1R20_g1817, partial [Candolleomyces eurysporus]